MDIVIKSNCWDTITNDFSDDNGYYNQNDFICPYIYCFAQCNGYCNQNRDMRSKHLDVFALHDDIVIITIIEMKINKLLIIISKKYAEMSKSTP